MLFIRLNTTKSLVFHVVSEIFINNPMVECEYSRGKQTNFKVLLIES